MNYKRSAMNTKRVLGILIVTAIMLLSFPFGVMVNAQGSDPILPEENLDTAPGIEGLESMTLSEGYETAESVIYDLIGSPKPKVTQDTAHEGKIVWNEETNALDINVGISAGEYAVVLTASNGVEPEAELIFTLTVEAAAIGPEIEGPSSGLMSEDGAALMDTYTYWMEVVREKPDGYVEDSTGNVTISTAEGLAWLISVVNGLNGEGGDGFDGKTVTLTANIDLEEYEWTPIGTSSIPFKGTFNGGNHEISYMFVDIMGTEDTTICAGLFGLISNGCVKNVKVTESKVNAVSQEEEEKEEKKVNYAGGIVGKNEKGTVTNCSFTGEVKAESDYYNYAGGIVGCNYDDVVITNCCNYGDLYASGSHYFNDTGGIVGYNIDGSVVNCSNFGSVTSSSNNGCNNAGGIVGSNGGGVKDCYNEGIVTAANGDESSAGGVVGYNWHKVTDCNNEGAVTAQDGNYNGAGGVAGFSLGEVTGCSNKGAVSAQDLDGDYNEAGGIVGCNCGSVKNCENSGTVNTVGQGENIENDAGGIVGYNDGVVTDCSNEGEVAATNGKYNYAGGIVGYNDAYDEGEICYDGEVTDCSNKGAVSAQELEGDYINSAGGIVGCNCGSVKNCENSGTVNSVSQEEEEEEEEEKRNCAGGVVGHNSGEIAGCCNKGEVATTGVYFNDTGGIVGYNESEVTDCSNMEKVTATGGAENLAGGVAGYNLGEVTDCNNKGEVTAIDGFDNFACGIVGYNFSEVTGCCNEGAVTAKGGTPNNVAAGIAGLNFGYLYAYNAEPAAAGVNNYNTNGDADRNIENGLVGNCYNIGKVTATNGNNNLAGGVIGRNIGEAFNCYNTGEITSNGGRRNNIGGVVGDNYGDLLNCYNTGEITANGGSENSIGGVVGENFGDLLNCYNAGKISNEIGAGDNGGITITGNSSNNAGGIVGNNKEGSVAYCYWLYEDNDIGIENGIGSGTALAPSCKSFTRAQGRGTNSSFEFTVPDSVTTGTLLDALNAWVENNKSEFDVLGWVQPYTINDNQGYPVFEGDALPPPSPGLTVPIRGGGQRINTPASLLGTTVTVYAPYLPTLENIAKAAAEAKGSVEVDCSAINDRYDTVLIREEILSTVAASDALGLEVILPDGKHLHLDQVALSVLMKDGPGDLQISVRTVPSSELSRKQNNLIGDALVLELNAFINGKEVYNFGAGLVTVGIPVTGTPSEYPIVWRMTDDKNGEIDLKAISCTYNLEYRLYEFDISSFSLYVVSEYPFTDTPDSAWYYEDTVFTYLHGLFQGTTKTTFAPLQDMKRSELVTVLWRMEGEPKGASSKKYVDVPEDAWFTEAITWATANGIVEGYGGRDHFGPEDSITRQQMVLILHRYAKYKGYNLNNGANYSLAAFKDKDDVSGYALEAMRWACRNGIIRGNDGMILPHNSASRAEIAAILHRFSENVAYQP